MSVGRFLLVNSLVILFALLVLLGFIFREDLQLGKAYDQLLGVDNSTAEAKSAANNSAKITTIDQSNSDTIAAPDESFDLTLQRNSAAKTATKTQTFPARQQANKYAELVNARQAYWNHNFTLAIESYRSLIQGEPDNADYQGELGNVFFTMQEFQLAVEHYYRAAILLQNQGERALAQQLVQPIMTINQQLAKSLQQQLNSPATK